MKRITFTITLILALFSYNDLWSQGAPPPPPTEHGATGNKPNEGGGAPLDGGTAILMAFGAAYGVRKISKAVKRHAGNEEIEN